jgi:hypothetical protein
MATDREFRVDHSSVPPPTILLILSRFDPFELEP